MSVLDSSLIVWSCCLQVADSLHLYGQLLPLTKIVFCVLNICLFQLAFSAGCPSRRDYRWNVLSQVADDRTAEEEQRSILNIVRLHRIGGKRTTISRMLNLI
jgi:hypothetical protein